MKPLSEVVRYLMVFVLAGFVGTVAYMLLTQQINLRGLLFDKTSGRSFSPGRLQMLGATLIVALYYLLLVFDAEEKGKLPNLPDEFLLLLGGSHLFYLGGKLYGVLATRLGFASPLADKRVRPNK